MSVEEHRTLKEFTPELVRVSEALTRETAVDLTPQRLVDLAADLVPNAITSAITWTRSGARPHTLAASDALALAVDTIQYETAQGPCLDALEADGLILADDLTSGSRWPEFARRCVAETPVRSVLGLTLKLGSEDRAAMNFYADAPGRFGDIDLGVASIFAPFVSLAVQSEMGHRRAENLEVALRSSRQIGTAMGILMARRLITADEALELLRHASQELNRKLRDVAAEVEMTGTLPPLPAPRRVS